MEGAPLPKGCVSIATAVDTKIGEYCDLAGVAADFRPPVATRGTGVKFPGINDKAIGLTFVSRLGGYHHSL